MEGAHRSKVNSRIHVLILGSYQPHHKGRLIHLRDLLREAGFIQTQIVEDFPDHRRFDGDPDVHFTRKSEYYITDWADAILFILFKDTDNQGVLSEFRFSSVVDVTVLGDSVVEAEDGIRLSSQVRGPIKITKVNYVTFSDDEGLFRMALGHVVKTVERLFLSLVNRED